MVSKLFLKNPVDGENVVVGQGNDDEDIKKSDPSIDLERLYSECWTELCAYLQKQFGDGPPEPSDIAQSAFAKLASLPDTPTSKYSRAFLFTVARNIAIDHKRRVARHVHAVQAKLIEDEQSSDMSSPEKNIINDQKKARLEAAIRKLNQKQREIILLSCFHNYTYQQIVAKTGWSYGDIYRNMEKALIKLNMLLSGEKS